MRPLALLLLAFVATPGSSKPIAHKAVAAAPLGEVAFANSGARAAQAPFLRGFALLHNFEYDRAAAAFREAQKADPGFAMAYWGEAMTRNHPVWMEQDKPAALAILARLGPTREARLAKAGSPRERAYLEAVELLYGPGTKEERDQLYSDRMAALFAAYPGDVDARAFYALSLLGLAHQGRDYALYMRSAALLEEVFPTHEHHPGVLHYLIHSYDDPVHAPLGLRAARRYGAVAPDAGHALHMTSHIFLALGLWPDVERVNVQAMAVVNRDRAAAGKPDAHCGHYVSWLFYARLQMGREVGADLAACHADGLAEMTALTSPIESQRSSLQAWADMAVRSGIETGHWELAGPPPAPDRYLWTQSILAYGDILAAGRDLPRLRAARARFATLASALTQAVARDDPSYLEPPRWAKIVAMQGEALETLAAGDADGAVATLRAATDAEAAIPAGFGPPLVQKPSAELLGDTLLALGRYDEAAAAYKASLAAAPNRRLSLRGAELAQQRRRA